MSAIQELKKVLASSDVTALIPEDLEPKLVQYMYEKYPLLNLMRKVRADGPTHSYNVTSSVPTARVVGEKYTPVVNSGGYTRHSVDLKILSQGGSVTHFAQSATMKFIDLLNNEIKLSVESMGRGLEFQDMFGSANDTYGWDGFESFVYNQGGTPQNLFTIGGVVTLKVLDDMIDVVNDCGYEKDNKVFLTSNAMISKISGLEARVGRQIQSIEYPGGFRITTYRGIPLLSCAYTRAKTATTGFTGNGAAAAGGSLTAGTYRYKIAAVTASGEQITSAGVTGTTASTNLTVDLTWTAVTGAEYYKIFRTGAGEADSNANYDYLTTVSGYTYDASGNRTGNKTTYSDTGALTPNAYVHPIAAANEEQIYLVNLDEDNGLKQLSLRNDAGVAADPTQLIRFVELAKTKSSYDYFLEAFVAAQLAAPKGCAIARQVTVS